MAQKKDDRPLMNLLVHIGKLLNDRLRATLGERGLHFGQARILVALLRNEELTQVAIGKGLNIKSATVTVQVKKLEAAGLIVRHQDEQDDRVMNVRLTPAGIEAAEYAVEVTRTIESELRSGLSDEDLEALRDPLLVVRNALGGEDPSIRHH